MCLTGDNSFLLALRFLKFRLTFPELGSVGSWAPESLYFLDFVFLKHSSVCTWRYRCIPVFLMDGSMRRLMLGAEDRSSKGRAISTGDRARCSLTHAAGHGAGAVPGTGLHYISAPCRAILRHIHLKFFCSFSQRLIKLFPWSCSCLVHVSFLCFCYEITLGLHVFLIFSYIEMMLVCLSFLNLVENCLIAT